MDGPEAVAVRHAVGGAAATQRMRAQRGGARSDEGCGHGNCRRRPRGYNPHLTGR